MEAAAARNRIFGKGAAMNVFGFFRHDNHPTSLHAGLLAAHGLASFDEPVTYIRIIGEGELPIHVSEGSVHQTLQAIECPITNFGSFEALCNEAHGIANSGRHVLLDLPSYARMFLNHEQTIDISITLLSLPAPAASNRKDRDRPLAGYPRENRTHIFPQQAPLQWILRCHQRGQGTPINLSAQAYSASALQPPCLGEHGILLYEVPALNDAQWSSLRAGAPLNSVHQASRILAWSLMLVTLEEVSCAQEGAAKSHKRFRAATQLHRRTREPGPPMRLLPRKLRALHQRRGL